MEKMALIRCPECGGEVSSSAGTCIHCGYRFIVCPECGEILSPDAQACGKCGYPLVAKPAAEPAPAPKITDFDKITGRVNKDESLKKKLSVARWFVVVLDFVVLAIAIWKLISWGRSDVLEMAINKQSVRDLCIAMIAISVVLTAIEITRDLFEETFFTLRSANWVEQNKIDCTEYLRSFVGSVSDARTALVYARITDSAILSENPESKKRNLQGLVAALILLLIAAIFTGVVLGKALDAYMYSRLWETKFDFKCLLWLIPVAVSGFLSIVVAAATCVNEKTEKQWRQAHGLPEEVV